MRQHESLERRKFNAHASKHLPGAKQGSRTKAMTEPDYQKVGDACCDAQAAQTCCMTKRNKQDHTPRHANVGGAGDRRRGNRQNWSVNASEKNEV